MGFEKGTGTGISANLKEVVKEEIIELNDHLKELLTKPIIKS